VYRALWARKFSIILGTLLLAAGGWYLTSRQQASYQATSLIQVQQRTNDPSQSYTAIATSQKLAQTYADIVATRTIARRIYTALGGKVRFAQIAGHVTGDAVTDLDLLRIHAKSTDPGVAQAVANAAPAALQAYVRETTRLAIQVSPAELATRPTVAVGASAKRNAMFAFVLGLVLNSGLVLAARAIRDPVDRLDDVERMVGSRVLVALPRLRFARGRPVQEMPRETVTRTFDAPAPEVRSA
jgi:capsular polysaccharide biosynthesis protein